MVAAEDFEKKHSGLFKDSSPCAAQSRELHDFLKNHHKQKISNQEKFLPLQEEGLNSKKREKPIIGIIAMVISAIAVIVSVIAMLG